MQVRLDSSEHKVYGSEKIIFLNPTDSNLTKICFHLYPNAFRDTSTTFAREDEHTRRQISSGVTSELTVAGISIDGIMLDSNAIDESGTLLHLTLRRPLAPRDSISISLEFTLNVPREMMRFGYNARGNYLLAHWHPILCGYQKGRLVDNEYHFNSEFFSNFSRYEIEIEVPPDFKIGSTGALKLAQKDSSRAQWIATADSVIDFAFAFGPAFEVFEADTLGVQLRYLLEKSHNALSAVTDAATKYSLAYCSENLFLYPYPAFTIVDFEFGASGMELPGMVAMSFPERRSMAIAAPLLRFVIAHEVAHEWFYGVVATNEAEEPWLDEGLSTYTTSRIMESMGDNLNSISVFGYRIGMVTFDRMFGLISKAEYPLNLKSWEYPDDLTYSSAVYYRASMVLATLEQLMGRARFDSALARFANEYKFKHPDTHDLLESLEQSMGAGLDKFYDQYIAGTSRVDYSVRSLEFKSFSGDDPATAKEYAISVTVAREFDGFLPQIVLVGLEDGTAIDTLWDGESKIAVFKFVSAQRPVHARIGMTQPVAIDENHANNSLYLKPFSWRLLTFEWDATFIGEFLLSLLL
jgi:hypothetical protein